MRILYLTHDVFDAASLKRARMLRAGGASVTLAGFRRQPDSPATLDGFPVIHFGRTHNARFVQRIVQVMRMALLAHRYHTWFRDTDLIIARNLEMLAIAVRGRSVAKSRAALVYESLDIHRLLLRTDAIGSGLRTLEGWLSRRAQLLITSSPAFLREYFEPISQVKLPTLLLENKLLLLDGPPSQTGEPASAPPWRIGWFGAIRCRKSFELLLELTKRHPGLVEVVLRGRPSYDLFPDFDARLANAKHMKFLGPYQNPEDMAGIYGDIHFSWAIDCFEEGQNSSWLLPNRLYEGGCYNAVPLAIEGVETSRFMAEKHIGNAFAALNLNEITTFFQTLDNTHYAQLKTASRAVSATTWQCTKTDCTALVDHLKTLIPARPAPTPIDPQKPVLVVIPCLNEAAHLAKLLDYLIEESQQLAMHIVVADGGSTDGTVDIAKTYANRHTQIDYLHNPKRLQSAAVNLAVSQYGDAYDCLIRLDAHAGYPKQYCQTLIAEATAIGADSVVVRVHTIGAQGFQLAAAAAQNSKLGNGGSAHRIAANDGQWVDHGHHAFMRIAAYRAVAGYDESFSHNEDAELDIRLGKAGYRIWLTRKTMHDYYPRATPGALFRQYRNYGRGRARTLLKHHLCPKVRQLLPVVILPALVLFALSPLLPIAALPATLWALLCLGYGALLAYKARQKILLLSGPAAMLMHAAWSLGFWQSLFNHAKARWL